MTRRGTEQEIKAAERTLSDASAALDEVCARCRTDTEVVAGFAKELQRLEAQLTEIGAGSAMVEVERRLADARTAVEKLGRSELSSIKTMKSPPPVIKRVISAVYMLLNPTRVTAPRFNVEWSGGPHSCQGLLGRRDFTAQIVEYDAAALCEHPALLSYVARNYIGEEGSGITESASAAELSPVSSPVRGPTEEPEPEQKLVSKSVVFGRRAGSPKKAPPSWKKAATMAKVTGTLNKSAADRRAARNADWAEVGYSDKVAPRRLSYDEVSYASKACGALYQWATTAVDTAKALEQLYPVKKECDALQERRDRLAAQLREAEERLGAVQKEETASEESVRKATAELERLRELLEKLKAEEAAKAEADAEAAKAKAQAAEEAAAKREAAVRRTIIAVI